MQNRIFIFGLGFTLSHYAQSLLKSGCQVSGTYRSQEKQAALAQIEGLSLYHFDGENPLDGDGYKDLLNANVVISSIPPDRALGDDPVLRHHLEDLTKLKSEQKDLWPHKDVWLGYLSTTGVYGDHQGRWVDEDSTCNPKMKRTQQRILAEEIWQSTPLSGHVFRLGGIYGPRGIYGLGRNALVSLRSGKARPIHKPDQYFGRIHIEDIAQVLSASIDQPNHGRVYNLCDDLPAPPDEVIHYARELLGLEKIASIPFDQADLSPMAASFYVDNKKVKNQRIKDELKVALKYPNYKIGLQAILNQEALSTED